MNKLVLKLFRAQEFSLEQRPLNVQVVFHFVQLLLLKVKGCLLLKNFFPLALKLVTCLLNLVSKSLELDFFSFKIKKVFVQLLPVSVNDLPLFLK